VDRSYQLEGSEMNRGSWEFEYTARDLAKAAEAQKTYRLSRVTVWEGKKDEVMQKIKDGGLTVHEGVAAQLSSYSNSVRGGASVMVDPTLQTDLSECVSKIQDHQKAATEYDGWIQMLSANAEARLKLKYHDWMFFFGK
jgi:hypothetical protein